MKALSGGCSRHHLQGVGHIVVAPLQGVGHIVVAPLQAARLVAKRLYVSLFGDNRYM